MLACRKGKDQDSSTVSYLVEGREQARISDRSERLGCKVCG